MFEPRATGERGRVRCQEVKEGRKCLMDGDEKGSEEEEGGRKKGSPGL